MYAIDYRSTQFTRRAFHVAAGKPSLESSIHCGERMNCHPQTDCFIVSQLFSAARHARIYIYIYMCVYVCVWYTPSANPVHINFFKPLLFLASDSSSGFRWGISHFFTATKNTTERVEEEQTNQHGVGSTPSARKGVLWRFCAVFRTFVDYRGRVFCAKLQQSYKECQLIFDCLPSLPPSADRPSPGLRCRLLSLGSFVNSPSVFSRTFLSSSTSGLVGDLELRPLCGFRAKANEEILWPAHTHTQHSEWLHSVTHIYIDTYQFTWQHIHIQNTLRVDWIDLISLFNVISTIMGYLMPKL